MIFGVEPAGGGVMLSSGVVLLVLCRYAYRHGWISGERSGVIYWSSVISFGLFGLTCAIAGVSRLI